MSKRYRGAHPVPEHEAIDTPEKAMIPIGLHLRGGSKFIEPCAGSGDLVAHMTAMGHECVWASDIAPRGKHILRARFEDLEQLVMPDADLIVTNPPFSRAALESILRHWLRQFTIPAMLLLPVDYMSNLWFAPYAPHIASIIPIGRVKWIPGSPSQSTENFGWFMMEPVPVAGPLIYPRQPAPRVVDLTVYARPQS